MKLGINKNIYKALILGGIILSVYTIKVGIDYIRIDRASELLKLSYDFAKVEELENREDSIDKITTKEVKNQLYDVDRSLRAYLKMQGSYSKLVLLQTTPNYIIYELHSDVLTSSRRFMLMYDVNIFGKVNDIREVEIVDFI